MKWNPFAKKNTDGEKDEVSEMSFPGMPDTKDMNMIQRFAMKRIMAMNPSEREKLMRKMLTPKNIEKNKKEILESLEMMRKSGQISDDQYRLTKARLGLK